MKDPWEGFSVYSSRGRLRALKDPLGGFPVCSSRGTVSGRGWPGAIGVGIEYVIVFKCGEFCSECENVKIVCIEYFLSAKEMSLKA